MKGTALTYQQRIGSLDRKITFRRVTETQSASGFPATAWSDLFDDFAALEFGTSNKESYQANAQISELRTTFVTRWNSNTSTVTQKDRISFNGDEYDIEGITEPLGRRRFLFFQAKLRKL